MPSTLRSFFFGLLVLGGCSQRLPTLPPLAQESARSHDLVLRFRGDTNHRRITIFTRTPGVPSRDCQHAGDPSWPTSTCHYEIESTEPYRFPRLFLAAEAEIGTHGDTLRACREDFESIEASYDGRPIAITGVADFQDPDEPRERCGLILVNPTLR